MFPDGSISYTPDGFSSSLSINFYEQNYNWDDIGNNVPGATDQFLYHCALSVESDFGSSGTSSNLYLARDALRNYFGFNANTPIFKTSYTTSAWINLLKGEIDLERPIIYGGKCDTCSVGHVWVIDGYDSLNKFHCNWGWNGTYQNVFYSLTNLTPGTHDYTGDQRAVINIYPKLDACSGLSGATIICSSSESYSISIPTTASVVWSKSSNLDQVGGNTNTTYTVNKGSSGLGYVTATIKNSQNVTFLTRTKDIWAGSFSNIIVTGQASVCPNSLYVYTAQVPVGDPSDYAYVWTYPSGWYKNSQWDNKILLQTPQYNMTYGPVRVSITNNCGTSGYSGITVYPGYCGGYYMSFSPNPTTGETTLTIESAIKEKTVDENAEWEYEIYNAAQSLKTKQTKLKGNSTILQTHGWKEGVYVVRVKYKDKILTGKLVVKE